MLLETRGLDPVNGAFSSIWARYVHGFDWKQHCQKCLKGRPIAGVHKDMKDGSLELRTDFEFLYVCALGRPRSADSNVHLVVRPHVGAVASTGSLYGATFTITDALAVRIKSLPKGWRGLGDAFTQCPNFQFGVQTFGYPIAEGALDYGRDLSHRKPLQEGEQ